MNRIAGQQARQLLDRVQPVGNWDLMIYDGEAVPVVVDRERNQKVAEAADCDIAALIAQSPDLAETAAWLYGRKPDNEAGSHWGDNYTVAPIGEGPDAALVASVRHMPLSPDEAVDLARALLAAAEEARSA